MYSYLISSSTGLGPQTKWFQDAGLWLTHFEIELAFESDLQAMCSVGAERSMIHI